MQGDSRLERRHKGQIIRHERIFSTLYISSRRSRKSRLRRSLKAEVEQEERILMGREFQTGQIRTKKESRKVEERAERRRRSSPEEPRRVLDVEKLTN